MLPLLYPSVEPAAILADPQSAPLPELHKAMFRWVEKFTRRSWEMTAADLQELRDAGVEETHLVRWANIACLQTWWVMSADGGGIPLEGNAVTGSAIGHERERYEAAPEGLTGAAVGTARATASADAGVAWVDCDETSEAYREAADWANQRYGFVPNLLRACSLAPEIYPRHLLALELLERPQSQSLSPNHHALVRSLVSTLSRCSYSDSTVRALVESMGEIEADADTGRVVLEFAAKLVRNAYKLTEKDALSFREAGLDDEAYVDVLNTVAIQTSLDRLANALGVAPDKAPLLPR